MTVQILPPPPAGVGSGLQVWLDAGAVNSADPAQVDGSGNVQQWNDLSSNKKHASNATVADRPRYVASGLNGKPVLRFGQDNDDNGDRLYLGDLGASFPTGASVFVVATIDNDGRYNLFGNRNNDERWAANTWNESRPGSFRAGRSGSSTFTLGDWPTTGSHVFSLESDSTQFEILINGSSIGTDTANYNSGVGNNWTIGNRSTNGQQLRGDIAELILYNRVLSAEEANAVGYYLANKYGVTSTYVNPNPTAPESLAAIAGDTEVSLTWATYIGATSYNVKRSETPGGPYTLVGTPTETSFTDSPLANGTPYYYVVSAVASSESPDSTEVTATPTGVDATLSTVVSSQSILWADGVASTTITVTLLNSSSTPVANKTVSLAQTSGSGAAINTVSDTTGVDGKAVFTVTSTTPGTCVLTATDVTDSNLVIEQTATVEFAAATTMAINVDIDNTVRAGLVGPIGGLGAVWNTKATSSATNLLHSSGPPTTVGYTSTNLGGPDEWGTPSLVMLRQGLRNFDTSPTNSQQLVINGLDPAKTYDLYIASGNLGGQGHNGVWATTNTTTTPGDHPCGNTTDLNGSTWVVGNNYVVFRAVVPDGSGKITVNGRSIAVPGFDCRLPMSGFQLIESVPGGFGTWADANGATGQTPDQDHDNDCVQNGIEYFMGQTGSSFTPMPGLDETNTVSWPMDPTFSGTYEVQTSTDLDTWTNVDPRPSPVAGILSYTLPLGAPGGMSFVRLLVTPTP